MVNTTTLAGILAASKAPVARYVPSYASTSSKTYKTVTSNNAAAAAAAKAASAKAAKPKPTPTKTATVTPVQTTPVQTTPVQTTPDAGQVDNTPAAPAAEPAPWNVYNDPFYQQQLAAAQSQFNLDRINALGSKQYQEVGLQNQLADRPKTAEAARRRLAGNYAARGMAGGGYGALSRAEAEQNASEIAARTSLREQMAELNRQYTAQYGAEGSDWLGTQRGMQAQQAAIQAAINNRIAGLTTVG